MSSPGGPTTQWQSLAEEVDQGRLYLNSDAARACYSACEAYISKLRGHQDRARALADIKGWGDFESGRQLQAIFSNKAVGGENNMVDVLQSHIDVVEEMKVVFDKFFTATATVDHDNAAGLEAEGPR